MLRIKPLICCAVRKTNPVSIVSTKFKDPNNVLRRVSTNASNKKNVDTTIDEGPVKFSTSKARFHKAEESRTGGYGRLPYEEYVVMISFATFLIYFTILREENDIDKELDRSLYSRIDGLEELQLKLSLQYNQEHGLDTLALEKRLEEIALEKIKTQEANPDVLVQEHA